MPIPPTKRSYLRLGICFHTETRRQTELHQETKRTSPGGVIGRSLGVYTYTQRPGDKENFSWLRVKASSLCIYSHTETRRQREIHQGTKKTSPSKGDGQVVWLYTFIQSPEDIENFTCLYPPPGEVLFVSW